MRYDFEEGGRAIETVRKWTHIIGNSRDGVELSAAYISVSRLRTQPNRRDQGINVGSPKSTYLLLVPKLQAT